MLNFLTTIFFFVKHQRMHELSDNLDPVVTRHIAVPPKLVEAVQTDPDILSRLSRAQLMLVQDKLTRQYLYNSEASITQGTAVAEILRKTANLEPKEARAGVQGASVVFNFNVGKTPIIENTIEVEKVQE